MLLRNWLLPWARPVWAVGSCVLVLAASAGCGSGSSEGRGGAALVRVTERDFRIVVAPRRVPAGDVRVVITNRGPDTHEMLIARTRRATLPLRSDGITADEDALAKDMIKELDMPARTVHHLQLHLAPGRYELFCNMFGHYLGGMRAELVVT
jgi:hypothetical protein